MSILLVFKILFYLLEFLGGSFFSQAVVFESLESKTEKGKVVFNKITLESSTKRDIWNMRQSHHGYHSDEWDSVRLIVHKDTTPFSASYHQLKNGVEVEYLTSCFRCHSGGPRLIRPNYESKVKSLSIIDKVTVLKWNLLIKSYGEVKVKKNNPFKRKIALVKDKENANKILRVNSCHKCHYEGGERAVLTKENINTIKFLINERSMPPWPYIITKKDKNKINKFIYGF
jgi:hypothetical protein